MASVSPRKKFSLQSEVAVALRKYNLMKQENGWTLKLDKSISSTILRAYHSKFLYVNGTANEFYLPIFSRPELMQYLRILPVPDSLPVIQNCKRLRYTPLFATKKNITRTNGGETELVKAPIDQLEKLYKWAENNHKSIESHHPDGIAWRGGIIATMECVFDVFNSLLRTNSLTSAYGKLFSILLDSKFDNLDIQGIFYAFLHISIRGVANVDQIYASGNWRRENITQSLLLKVTRDFSEGLQPRSLISSYVYETRLHAEGINSELMRLRAPAMNHDFTKFEPQMIYSYCWYWGIFQRYSETNKNRYRAGLYEVVDEVRGRPTMFSLGNSFGNGLVESSSVKEIVDLIKKLPSEVGGLVDNSLTKAADKIERSLSEQQDRFKDNLSELVQENAKVHEEVGEKLIDRIVEKSKTVGDTLMQSFEPALDVLKSFTGVIDSMIQKVAAVFAPIPGFSSVKLSSKTLFDALSYYIVFINTESTVLKTVLVVLILNSFGLIKSAFSEILRFWSWTQTTYETSEGIQGVAGETSGMFEWLCNSPSALISTISGVICSMIRGIPLSSTEFFSLSKRIADNLKNFHFISQGIAGVTRLFEYIKKAYTAVVEWIGEHLFGRTPEKIALGNKVYSLITRVKYLHTEAGLNAVRMSEGMRKQAETILPEYLSLQNECRKKVDFRHLFNDLEKVNRQVKEVSDFVTRLRAMSNFQPTMFHIQFVGRPGIGKSTITKNVVSDISKTLWPDEGKPSFYSYNTDLEYFDGYAGQKIMIVDDLYKINEPKHLTTSMFLITNTPVILPMANLNDKGVQLTSEILITSTNTAYPLGKDILCMEAIHRRRHMLVEVQCDPDVLDPSLGQFSLPLYKKKYKETDLQKFPHLKFNLLRPVPKEFGGAAAFGVGKDEYAIFMKYASELDKANIKIAIGGKEVDPMYYFSEDNQPPPGITLPTCGWSYEQFIANCAVRFRTFRGAEGTYSAERKYAHVENCFAEIDMLLNQREDIPDGVYFPTRVALEKLFCRAQHPYGTEDEIGKKIAKDPEANLAPELNDIDLNKIVDDILSDPAPTGEPSMSLDEERIRTQNILRRKGKVFEDPILRDMLRIVEKNGRKVIELTSFYTGWHAPPMIDSDKIHEVFSTLAFSDQGYLGKMKFVHETSFMYFVWKIYTSAFPQIARNANTIMRWAFSPEMIFPDTDAFPESIRGRTTSFPISFFKDMKKIDGRWYLDVTDIGWREGIRGVKIPLVSGDQSKTYELDADIALMLSLMPTFRAFVIEFESLTTIQQDQLIQDAKWRSAYFGSYSYDKISQDCQNIFLKSGYKLLSFLTSPFMYVAEKYPLILTIVAYLITYVAVIFIIGKISELFQPRPTSKFLHKSQAGSSLHFGRPTSMSVLGQLVENFADKNVREIVVSDSASGQKAQALFTGQYILLNSHVLRNMKEDEFVLAVLEKDGKYSRHIISQRNVYCDPLGDLAIIYSPSIPASRKIDQHFYTEAEYENHDITQELVFLARSSQGVLLDRHRALNKSKEIKLVHKNYTGYIRTALMVDGHTVAGLSGSTVVSIVQSRPRILGIQAWETDIYTSPKIAVQIITKERFDDLVLKIQEKLGMIIPQRLEEYEPTTLEGNVTSAFSSVPIENIVGIDEHHVGRVGKSQIKASIIQNYLKEEGLETQSVPAALTQYDKRLYHGGKIHPLEHSLGKYFRGEIQPFSPRLMNRIKSGLTTYIGSKLDKSKFRILSFEDSITGTREDGSNPMNLSTSPGIPFIFEKIRKGKRDYLEIDEEGILSYDQEFYQQYFEFEQQLRKARVPLNRAYDFPKDELRPIQKALGSSDSPPKTRTVTCMNVNYIIAWRRFTLDFWASMHRAANGTFTFCPGMNPEGPDWNNLYHYLNSHPNVVDFDVSNWDGYLRADLFHYAIDLIIDLIGGGEETKNVLHAIAFEVMNSYIQFDNVIYQKFRGMVSGFPGTAEMNTLAHWLLITYIYLTLTVNTPYNTLAAMFTHTAIAIYGDDIIISFSDEIKQYFNGITIMSGYQEIGYPVTAASKSGEVLESRSLLECTFLKSSWRQLIPSYFIRKMDISVIINLVSWTRYKQDPIIQFYDNYIDALRVAFSNGEECFEWFRDIVNRALLKVGQDIIVYDYLDFERDYFKRYIPQLSKHYIKYTSTY